MAAQTTRTTGSGGTATGTGGGPNWLAYAPVVGLACIALLVGLLRPAYPVPQKGGIVVVTGTSSGIGNQIATELADKGFHVYAGVRRQASLNAWKRVNHPNITPVMLDVTDPSDIQAVVKQVEKERKKRGVKLAGLVGNAG